jgi:hypothetical protein
MEWHLKNLMTPKIGVNYTELIKDVTEELSQEVKKTELADIDVGKSNQKNSCVICGKPAIDGGYCENHL